MDAGPRTFLVRAWPSDGRLVLYVPEIEASTLARDMAAAEAAVRSLICDLTGLAPETVACEITLGRPR